jgi:sulfopropanediol 3-dehydrogenase
MAEYLKSAPATTFADRSRHDVAERVAQIIADVRTRGDAAVRDYSGQFDSWTPESFRLDAGQVAALTDSLPDQVIEDIDFVQTQVRRFAQVQRDSMLDVEIETLPGVRLGHRHVPISAAGAYVPGGRYPLTASAHMTVVTAKVAGVERVAACTPPIRGEIPAATIAAMSRAGADEIYVPVPATPTSRRPSASSSARSASTSSRDPRRSSSSPTTTPIPSPAPSTCSPRPSTALTRPPCS